jgi:hypothetical protein
MLIALAVGCLLSAVSLAPYHASLLTWDEVDYVRAAELGLAANALESGSLTPGDFAALAMAKRSGADPPVPEHYDESRDPLLLRHYHPPFVTYLLSLVAPSASERVMRLVQLLGAFCLLAAALLGYGRLAKAPSPAGASAVIAFGLWLVPPLFASISFHGWLAVWLTLGAALLSSRRSPERRQQRWWPFGVVCGFAALTLETGVLLLVACFLALLLVSGQKQHDRTLRGLWITLGVSLLTLLVAWPGVWLKASLAKILALHGYRLALGQEYAPVGQRVMDTAGTLAPGLVVGTVVLASLARTSRLSADRWLPFALVSCVYGTVMVPVALQPLYLLPALAPLAALAGFATDQAAGSRKALFLVAAGVVALHGLWPRPRGDVEARNDLQWLSSVLRGRRALVEGGHVYQYYLPGYDIRPVTVDYAAGALYERVGVRYRPLNLADFRGAVIVVHRGRLGIKARGIAGALGSACRPHEGVGLVLFDCSAPTEQ